MKTLMIILFVNMMISMAGCGGGGGSTVSAPFTSEGAVSVVAKTTFLLPNDPDCNTGGILIETGIDKNGNGVLDITEITNKQKVCNGATGATGADGLNALVQLYQEPIGANCITAGVRITNGMDNNKNGMLDAEEVSSTSYICNGATGATGTDGLNALVQSYQEPIGANCITAGVRITNGMDNNKNGMLDAEEVSSTSYICNGATGAASVLKTSTLAAGDISCPTGGVLIETGIDHNGNGILDSPEVTSSQKVCNGVTVNSSPVFVSKVVAADGSGDYTTITAALNDITDATINKQYNVYIKDGFYNEVGQKGNGLELKNYVHLLGAGRNRVTVKGPEATAGSEYTKDTIHCVANCTISSMSLVSYKNKYCIHADGGVSGLGFVARDISTIHYGGADGYAYDIGIGFHPDQKLTFENVDCQGKGIYMHGVYAGRTANTVWEMVMQDVSAKNFYVDDFLEYSKNIVTMSGCEIDELQYRASRLCYDTNPTDVLYNRGWFNQSVIFKSIASKIGRVVYMDKFTSDTIMLDKLIFDGMNIKAINMGIGAISKGQAVKLLTDPAISNSYPSATMQRNNVAAWDGSGIFAGVAETDMPVNAISAVQTAGYPYVLADASGASIAYADALEINSSGIFRKQISGIIRGYALEDKSSGTGLIKAMLY